MDKDMEMKAKKAAAAKAWKEKKDKEAVDRQEKAKQLLELLDKKSVELAPELREFLEGIALPKRSRSRGGQVFWQMFGPDPKPGDKVTLKEAFEKTLKSFAELNRLRKQWADKGFADVDFVQEGESMLESSYLLKQLSE